GWHPARRGPWHGWPPRPRRARRRAGAGPRPSPRPWPSPVPSPPPTSPRTGPLRTRTRGRGRPRTGGPPGRRDAHRRGSTATWGLQTVVVGRPTGTLLRQLNTG